MPKIHFLPEEIRSKIAAGEVIERPASVIKELLENAFDAKADFIKLEFEKGGLKRISVYDNGIGMAPEDLKLCYKSFATSKIKELSDIFAITTYGFRGEALASIAQVSRLKIVSVERGSNLAFEIEVEFGKEKAFSPARLKEGTLVEVRDLFENLPARKAFLKSIKTESAKNTEIFKALLLSHPEIKAQLLVDERELINWKGGPLKELFSYLFEIPEEYLKESRFESPPYKIELLLTDTKKTFSHGRFLLLFVNNRFIKDEKILKFVYHLLKRFFGNLGFPAGVIKIEAPAQLVDFNVHPAKWEIRFKREKEVFSSLEEALKNHFLSKKIYLSQRDDSNGLSLKIKEDIPLTYRPSPRKTAELHERAPLFEEGATKEFKILGAFKETYILIEKGESLFIVDQHALSERIHYELLKKREFIAFPQKLLLPFLVKLTPDMLENIEEKLEILSKLGFDLELVSQDEILVKGAPPDFLEFAEELLESLLQLPEFDLSLAREKLLKDLACKKARKKGDSLTQEEKSYLIEMMFKYNLETCPHGRPLYIKIDLSEVEKKLKRKL